MPWVLPYSSGDDTVDNLLTAYNQLAGVLNQYVDFYNDWLNYHILRSFDPAAYWTRLSPISTPVKVTGDEVQFRLDWLRMQTIIITYLEACQDHTALTNGATYLGPWHDNYKYFPNGYEKLRTDANTIIDATALSVADKAASKFTTSAIAGQPFTRRHGDAGLPNTSYGYVQFGDDIQHIHFLNQLWACTEVMKNAGLHGYFNQDYWPDTGLKTFLNGEATTGIPGQVAVVAVDRTNTHNRQGWTTSTVSCAHSLTDLQADWAANSSSPFIYNAVFQNEFLVVREFFDGISYYFDSEIKQKLSWSNISSLPTGSNAEYKLMHHSSAVWCPENNVNAVLQGNVFLDMEGSGDLEDDIVDVSTTSGGVGAVAWTDTSSLPSKVNVNTPEPAAHASVSCPISFGGWGQSWTPISSCNYQAPDPV